MTVVACPATILQFFNNAGQPAVGGSVLTQVGGSNFATYQDSAGLIPLPNPIPLNSRGEVSNAAGQSCQLFLTPNTVYQFTLYDGPNGTGNLLNQATYVSAQQLTAATVNSLLTAIGVGTVLYPATPAETATGLTLSLQYPYGNMLRYGIVTNSVSAAAANLAIIQSLFSPSITAGPTGYFYFPNTTGSDVYSFGGTAPTVPIRQYVHIDGNYCTISVTGTSSASDINVGFFYALYDFTLENMTITSAVNTSAGVNAAATVMLGGRGVGSYFTIFESTLGSSLGRITLKNLTVQLNNTGGNSNHAIAMLGGFSDVLLQNLTISVGGAAGVFGIYYEWGIWTNGSGPPGTMVTSHAKNMIFENIRVISVGPGGAGLGLTGCYSCIVDGLYVNAAPSAFVYSVGQAMFYNVSPNDTAGQKRSMTLRNIVGQSITSTGIVLAGSNTQQGSANTPSLASDLMSFDLDGFAIQGTTSNAGLSVSGNITARNGLLDLQGGGLNPLIVQDDCMYSLFENVRILNGAGGGVRADLNSSNAAWSPIRQKFMEFRGCQIAGNLYGFELNNIASCKIVNCRIGYNTLYDPTSETTQTIGVLVPSGCNGVVCDSNFVTTSGGPSYSISGVTSSGCNIINPLGNQSYIGTWEFNGVAAATSGNLGSKSAVPNIGYKYYGKQCINSSVNKVFVSQGSTPTSPWISTDGVTTITPS